MEQRDTAARVAWVASATRSFFSFTSTSVPRRPWSSISVPSIFAPFPMIRQQAVLPRRE
jgi:hypothetical protein